MIFSHIRNTYMLLEMATKNSVIFAGILERLLVDIGDDPGSGGLHLRNGGVLRFVPEHALLGLGLLRELQRLIVRQQFCQRCARKHEELRNDQVLGHREVSNSAC
jgi:hypothetical protein